MHTRYPFQRWREKEAYVIPRMIYRPGLSLHRELKLLPIQGYARSRMKADDSAARTTQWRKINKGTPSRKSAKPRYLPGNQVATKEYPDALQVLRIPSNRLTKDFRSGMHNNSQCFQYHRRHGPTHSIAGILLQLEKSCKNLNS